MSAQRLLHHPAKPRVRPLGPRLRQRRHVTDHIAERGSLDEQDVGYLQMPRRSRTAAAGLSTVANTCMHVRNRMSLEPATPGDSSGPPASRSWAPAAPAISEVTWFMRSSMPASASWFLTTLRAVSIGQ